MSRTTRLLAALAAVTLLLPAAARASEKLAATTGKSCVTCHDKPGSKQLTDEGKYFEIARSLDGYDRLKASFGKCTSCHVRKPGSAKLTAKGRQMSQLARDMAELKQWLEENHPKTP